MLPKFCSALIHYEKVWGRKRGKEEEREREEGGKEGREDNKRKEKGFLGKKSSKQNQTFYFL